jgi:hypothetical protein
LGSFFFGTIHSKPGITDGGVDGRSYPLFGCRLASSRAHRLIAAFQSTITCDPTRQPYEA